MITAVFFRVQPDATGGRHDLGLRVALDPVVEGKDVQADEMLALVPRMRFTCTSKSETVSALMPVRSAVRAA